MIGGCFSIIGGIQTLLKGNADIRLYCEEENVFGSFKECVALFTNIELGTTCTSMVIACFHIIFSILLLYGIFKQKTAFFVPLMTVYAVQIGLMILGAASAIALFLYLGLPFGVIVIFAAIMGGAIFLETYFLLVIRAHYYQIKREKGHIHMALKEQNVETPPPPYPGPHAAPPYPTNEPMGYPSSDAPLYPSLEKAYK